MDSGMVPEGPERVFVSCLRGDLPAPSLMSTFITGATGGLSRWRPFFLFHVTARPATKAPVTALLLTGSSLYGGPQWNRTAQHTHVPQPLLQLGTPSTCQPGTLRIVRMALLTEPVSSEVYGRCDPPASEREPGTAATEARTGPGPLYPRNGKRPHDNPENMRRHSELAPTKTR